MAEISDFDVEVRDGLPHKGRGLFAKRCFQVGEVVLTEQPLVSSQFLWNALYKYSACNHCMKPLETAEEACRRLSSNSMIELPHPECCEVHKEEHIRCNKCQVWYCSESCRQLAWNHYHATLCTGPASQEDLEHPLFRLEEAWRNMHYPPETCSIMLVARMIATIKQSKDRDKTKELFSRFCKATINEEESIAHKLLGEQFQSQLELLRNILMETLHDDDVQQWFTPEGFRSLFALIGTNGQGIGTSSFSVWVKNCESLGLDESARQQLNDYIDKLYDDMDKVSGEFLNCEGSGLYAMQSLCNHSCIPNAEVTFPNNNFVLSIKAVVDIKQGDEIFISYLDECDRDRSRYSRQKLLRENYLFSCSCEKCISQADDPDMTSEEEDESDGECMDHSD